MTTNSDKDNLAKLRELNHDKLIEVDHQEQPNIEKGPVLLKDHQDIHQHDHDDEDHQCKVHQKSKRNHHGNHQSKSGKKNYLIIIYTIFTCLSCLYLETQELNPYLADSKSKIMSFICYLDVFLCLWSYIQTMRTGNFVDKLNLKDHYPYPNMKTKKCQKCNYVKMPRVSHCSSCGKCIYKLDHHCIWTQTCIGYCNQRPFYLFTVYMTIGVLQFWYSTIRVASSLSDTCHFFGAFEPGVYILWAITCISAGIVGLMIVALAVGHTLMVATNFTTLDSMKQKKICPLPFIECRKAHYSTDHINQWDRGEIQNLKSLFGKNILTCWLPFGRQIQNEFMLEPMNPFVIIGTNTGSPDLSPENFQKKLTGKIISVNDELIPFENL